MRRVVRQRLDHRDAAGEHVLPGQVQVGVHQVVQTAKAAGSDADVEKGGDAPTAEGPDSKESVEQVQTRTNETLQTTDTKGSETREGSVVRDDATVRPGTAESGREKV